MDPWMTEIAKAVPVVGFLGAAVYALWRKLQEKDQTIAALTEQARTDQKEHSQQLLESSRHMDRIINTKKISDVMHAGYMTCASCHEVHNTKNSENDPSVNTPGFTPNYFVYAREQNSALCLSCHVK